jgi:hypothetical protein
MATPSSMDANIPQYLEYRSAPDLQTKGSPEETAAREVQLEKANAILHARVLRKDRDKLCTGCARFDWVGTHFYTRHVTTINHEEPREEPSLYEARELSKVGDDIPWQMFKLLAGMIQDIELLAKHPRFVWFFDTEQQHGCTFCDTLSRLYRSNPFYFRDNGQVVKKRLVHIRMMVGPVFEQRQGHACRNVSFRHHLTCLGNVLIEAFQGLANRAS